MITAFSLILYFLTGCCRTNTGGWERVLSPSQVRDLWNFENYGKITFELNSWVLYFYLLFVIVRNRLSYEQFGAFLANVKELNSHKQTKEVFPPALSLLSQLIHIIYQKKVNWYISVCLKITGNATESWWNFWAWKQGSVHYIWGID